MPAGPVMATSRNSPPAASVTHRRSAARAPVRPTRATDHARLPRGSPTGPSLEIPCVQWAGLAQDDPARPLRAVPVAGAATCPERLTSTAGVRRVEVGHHRLALVEGTH